MTHKYYLFLFILLTSFSSVFAQDRKEVQGKVVAKFFDLEGIYVENITARKNTTTEKGGYFKILMQPNDTLIFASVNLKGIKRVVKETDFSKRLMFIPMEVSENNLEELIIDKRITSESLGFVSKKKRTPAEKSLYTATSSAGGIIPIDAIVNAFSGRTAMLKKALEYEREGLLVKKIINTFEEDYFVDELKIPKNNIEGFAYFLAQDLEIVKLISTQDKESLKFLMIDKSIEYKELLKVLE